MLRNHRPFFEALWQNRPTRGSGRGVQLQIVIAHEVIEVRGGRYFSANDFLLLRHMDSSYVR